MKLSVKFSYSKGEKKENEENLFKFQPPHANRNKLPKFSHQLLKIYLENLSICKCKSLPDIGSIFPISGTANPTEILITADPKIILYTERNLDPPKCDLQEDFGQCSLPIVDKNRDS